MKKENENMWTQHVDPIEKKKKLIETIVCSMGFGNRIVQSPDENYFNVCRQHKEK